MQVKLVFLAFIFIHFTKANAQSTTTLMGARSMGLGFSSSTTTDEWSLFNNIGGLGKINQTSVSFAYELRPALTGANRLAASLLTPTKIGAFGVGVFRFGDDLYSEQVASIGFGNSIGNTSLGANARYIQYQAEGFGTTTAMSVNLGGISRITPQLSVGAYITNLTQSKLIGTGGDRLPTKLVAGLGFTPSEKIFVITEIEKDLDYPVTWRSGLEYVIYKKVFFRTGFNMNPNAGYFGLGARKKNLKVDYSIGFNFLTGVALQASATYLFLTKQKK
jgi:hypothetical protein